MADHDLLVVGGGAANNLATAAADEGLDVGLIEKGPLGGACLTRGCDPSKTLLARANVAEQVRAAGEFGVDAELTDIDFQQMIAEATRPYDEEAERMAERFRERDELTFYETEGRFVGDRALDVDGDRVTAEKVVVAVGARPTVPDAIDGVEDVDYRTSDELLRLDERPDRLVIVGGGYVAAELGYFYGAMGTDVTVVGRSDRLLAREDAEVAAAFTEAFAADHEVLTGHEAAAVEQDGDEIAVRAEGDDGERTVTGDELLVATGRAPNTDVTDVEAGGIDTDEKGFVETDERLEASAENVWALGDAVGPPMFRHTADREAEVVLANAVYGEGREIDYTGNAHAVFASPEVAALGDTEEELDDAGREYVVGRAAYDEAAMGRALKADEGFAKVLADPDDGEILGCHVLGPEASTLIHEAVIAVTAGDGTVGDIADAIHVHPALNEVVEAAFEDARAQ